MSFSKLQSLSAGVQYPIIMNAPMAGTATPAMAAEVTKAGGFGFLGCIYDIAPGSANLKQLESSMIDMRTHLTDSKVEMSTQLPCGVGFLTGHSSIGHFQETALPLIKEYLPAAVWLFAPDEEVNPHPNVISSIKSLAPAPKVFVQVGNIESARVAATLGADVLVCQGTDAGGHQFRRGKGVVSLVAAVKYMLKTEPELKGSEIAIAAAGGIVNGEGVAALMAMGIDGVVMGTRFTVAHESGYPEFRQDAVLAAKDGIETLKSPFHDQLAISLGHPGPYDIWGPLYDGRAIMTEVHKKHLAGASVEDIRKSIQEDYSEEDAKTVAGTWAGTGVGLVNEKQPAASIAKEVREEAREAIKNLTDLFQLVQ